MMEGALRGHFRKGRGKKLVERNQWQLFDPSSPRNILSAENWEPFPGMKITMAMIIPQSDNQMVCPRLNCSSKSYTDALGGGKLCSECNTWFDSLPKSSSPQKITAIVDSTQYSGEPEAAKLPAKTTAAAKSGLQIRNEDTGSDSEFEIDEEDLRLLKNARVRLEGPKQLHLKKREADVVITEEVVSLTPLSWAAGNGNDTRVNLLLAKDGIDLDLKDSQFSRTPLSWAAENGHEAVVKLLLETGKVEAVVKLLLETGKVEVDSKDKYNNRTPLSCAAENGHEAVVKLLLETGKAEVDSGYDRTPLSWAAENGHETVVKLLLETGRSRDVE
ncbi:ankyrin repeat-containing domain protein [Leptodontidium sp. 2 PMI_412]|nr:ankyrin repeat-containing domain protein [Leptodontidium sp. 2 PMI_412]